MWIFNLQSAIFRFVRCPWFVVRCKEPGATDQGRCPSNAPRRSLTPGPWPLAPLLAGFCLLLSAHYLFAAGRRYEVREIKPNVFVWIPEDILDQDGDPEFNRAGTAGFVITPESVVVVDTTNSPFHARELLYEIRKRTDAPVKYVINTDAEGDHMLGNEVFLDQRATIISSAAAEAMMRRYQQELAKRIEEDWRLQSRMRGFHLTLPTQTFDGTMSVVVGGEEMKLLNFDPGRSIAEAVVFLPGAKVLFLGELFRNCYFPRVGSRDVRRWIEILRQVESWDEDWYVPGHGSPGNKKQLAEFRQFLEWLANGVETRAKKGESLTQVKGELNPSENYRWRAPELASEAVEDVYQQIVGGEPGAVRTTPTPATSPQ